MNRSATLVTLSVCATVATAAIFAGAGPLDPPPGPISSTYGPESRIPIGPQTTPGDEDSLFQITEPGSYVLKGNVTGVEGKHGIVIAASNVTLDLNGFTLEGVAGSLDGVAIVTLSQRNLEVRGGVVRRWEGGIDFRATSNNRIVDVRAEFNRSLGVRAGDGAYVAGCVARENYFGIVAGAGSTVVGCAASKNIFVGIDVGERVSITGCSASENVGGGIVAAGAATITGCTVSSNEDFGIVAGPGSTVSNCVARANAKDGILTGVGCTISGCSASFNGGDGIEALADSFVFNNACSDNAFEGGGAGIRVSSSGTRVDSNTVTNNGIGIDVDGKGNLIVRNSASGNTVDYDIIPGNSKASTGGLSGLSGPWANFSF